MRYLDIKYEWALTNPLLCWYATSGAGGLRVGTSSYCVIRLYEISQHSEIAPRQSWFIPRILRRCSLWCSTDSYGYISFITLWIFVFISAICRFNITFFNFANFRQLQIPNAQRKYYEIWPAYTKTPHNATHEIANRYFELKYHFLTLK